ncbi:FAD-binding oxidoreductase [Devosia sp. MC532]|uniref:FAD-binding oxidoreductase n=1 Tax=Devosia sp. MC532 TaxID=2799788 RepID=UPI0018F388E5|nr:FAD-binding oxidoreductase [Devosia sp. MC532]MBJ7579280.1 FAD-binding oxidoreductase [Devosia sp. MC532]
MLTRRLFLTTSLASLTAFGLLPAKAEVFFVEPSAVSADQWAVLKKLLGDQLVSPTDSAFANAALPNNLRFEAVRPQAVAYCRTAQMVAEVVLWCRDNAVPFAIRGGGHSYAGYSTSAGLIIDMADMGDIAFDPPSGVATIGAGAINSAIYAALDEAGRTITHGRCPTVGVSGFLLGGGIGFNMRRFGMGCDHVVGAEIVTSDGKVLQLSQTENADLFWAVRGGAGGNFGVMTKWQLQTHPADESLTVFRMVWRDNVLDVATKLFETLDAAPTTIGTRVSLGALNQTMANRGRQVPLTLLGQFAGPKEAFLELMQPVLEIGTPDFEAIEEHAYWAAQDFLAEEGEPAYYRERSTFHQSSPDRAFLASAIEKMAHWPGTGSSGNLVFFQTGGQVNTVRSDATAFVHRTSHWLSTANLSWSEDDATKPAIVDAACAWQDDLYSVVTSADTKGAFQNFPDPSLSDWRTRYYGENLPRLEAIKTATDPEKLFRFEQSL